MKIHDITIHPTGDTFTAVIVNGNGLKIHIHDCESEEIAELMAKDRIEDMGATEKLRELLNRKLQTE